MKHDTGIYGVAAVWPESLGHLTFPARKEPGRPKPINVWEMVEKAEKVLSEIREELDE